jgi:hypothetical protein
MRNIYTLAVVAIIACTATIVCCEKVPTDSEVISMIDKLDAEESLPLFGGLSLVKVESDNDNVPRSSQNLADRIIEYIQSHSVNYENEISEARSSVGGKTKPHVIIKKVKSTSKNFYYKN